MILFYLCLCVSWFTVYISECISGYLGSDFGIRMYLKVEVIFRSVSIMKNNSISVFDVWLFGSFFNSESNLRI